MTALNLDLVLCLPLLPIFLIKAVGVIIDNSPTVYIVKQVDYIVWKVIFLLINCTLVNAAIWWPFITSSTQIVGKNDGSNDKTLPSTKLQIETGPAR